MKINIYKETQPLYFIIFILLAVNIAIYFFSVNAADGITHVANIFTTLLFLVIIVLFYKFEIIVTNNIVRLSFGIGLIKKQINIKDITTIKSHIIPFYTGLGIRILGNSTMQYNGRIGKAVKLTMNDSKSYVMSTKNPEELIELINKLKNEKDFKYN